MMADASNLHELIAMRRQWHDDARCSRYLPVKYESILSLFISVMGS